MDEEIRNAYQKYAQQLLHRALEYLKQLEEEKDRLSGEKAEELLYEAMMCGDREERRDAAYCLGTLYRDFFPSPPDRKRALYFFYQSYLWGGGENPNRSLTASARNTRFTFQKVNCGCGRQTTHWETSDSASRVRTPGSRIFPV